MAITCFNKPLGNELKLYSYKPSLDGGELVYKDAQNASSYKIAPESTSRTGMCPIFCVPFSDDSSFSANSAFYIIHYTGERRSISWSILPSDSCPINASKTANVSMAPKYRLIAYENDSFGLKIST